MARTKAKSSSGDYLRCGSKLETQTPKTQILSSDVQLSEQIVDMDPTDKHSDVTEALRCVGYRGPEWYEQQSGPQVFCTCESVQDQGYFDAEKFIRCGNRYCEKQFFHLRCVKLSDHPPMKLGWMCPGCLEAHGIQEAVNGLWDLKDSNRTKESVGEWMRSERERKNRRLRMMFWEQIGNEELK